MSPDKHEEEKVSYDHVVVLDPPMTIELEELNQIDMIESVVNYNLMDNMDNSPPDSSSDSPLPQAEPAEDLNKFRNLDPDGNIGPDGGQHPVIFNDILASISSERHISREDIINMFPGGGRNQPEFSPRVARRSSDLSIEANEIMESDIPMPNRHNSDPL